MRRSVILMIVIGLALGGLVLFLALQFPEALTTRGEQIQLTHALLLVAVIGGAAIAHGRFQARQALRHAAIWVGLGAVLLLGYSFRAEFQALGGRLTGELLPHRAQEVPGGGVTIRAGAGGHFIAEATVNGVAVRFLVDTGASEVVLSPRDAERLGFDLKSLSFNRRYQTANGTVTGAPVRLEEIRIGHIVVRDVRASVNGADMKRSLLGMSFLGRLGGYRVDGDVLTLSP
ncbi:TIGR02281 family clan AA aspartic protease [Thalassospiraceae bacterium LMO-SO8]|nr:TIGR02281 family clan AA aspartic protease [Alphaproteobacteria bacterium LMO-S08]WND75470.1 TIGR02281 family clan AA aspartic protease [Thalassospiraceae bacterium LMO-SO8]